jgi:hypothetical protein
MKRNGGHPYKNEIILGLISKTWFKKNSALTRMLIDDCNGQLTLKSVAFALTAVSSRFPLRYRFCLRILGGVCIAGLD